MSTLRNADKKARQFDFNAMFEGTLKNLAAKRNQEKDSNELRIDSEKESFEDQQQNDSGTAEDNSDDEFIVPIPDGFVPGSFEPPAEVQSTKDVDLAADDYIDFGDGIPIIDLIPTSSEAELKHGRKPVSASTFDHQGTRFTTGGVDYAVNIYEFQKMDSSLRASKELTPCECHVVNSLAFSSNGEHLLVASSHAQIRILDKQGKQWAETVRGDQYLVDLSNTKGHTAAVNACCWHPLIKSEFLSCSDDATLRIWSLEDYKEITHCINKQRKVIKTKGSDGRKVIPTFCTYSRDGKLVAAGCMDGSIQIWRHGQLYVTPKHVIWASSAKAITSMQFSPNGKQILSRSLDGTLKIWSLETSSGKLVCAKENLKNDFIGMDCGFSPRGELVFTGTSFDEDEKTDGSLMFFDSSNLDLVYQIKYPKLSCMRIVWHPKINQILVCLSDGSLRLYYDVENSSRGALDCVTRSIRRARKQEVVREELILSPLTLEMFQPRGEEGEEKEVTSWRLKKYLRMQDNKLRPEFRKPAEMPMSGPSSGGRVAASGGTLHSYIAKQMGTMRNRDFLAEKDIRSAITRHAEEAEKNPYYVSKAYKRNQPVAIFQEATTEADEEGDNELEPVYKIPKKN